jgi:hypothetical protein
MFVAALSLLSAYGRAHGEPVTSAPAAVVASGSPLWVDSQVEPGFAIINAKVDIGSLRQQGDAIEAELAWPLRLGALNDTRAAHPGVAIPDGSASVYVERILCRENHALSYSVENRIVSPDGKTLYRQAFNAEEERGKAEEQERAALLPSSYGPDPYSLVCWAAARKCIGEDYRWPPPPNLTPLEYSDRATKMRADYNRRFIPRCQLSASRSSTMQETGALFLERQAQLIMLQEDQ